MLAQWPNEDLGEVELDLFQPFALGSAGEDWLDLRRDRSMDGRHGHELGDRAHLETSEPWPPPGYEASAPETMSAHLGLSPDPAFGNDPATSLDCAYPRQYGSGGADRDSFLGNPEIQRG